MAFQETCTSEWSEYRARKSGAPAVRNAMRKSSQNHVRKHRASVKKSSYYYDHLMYYIIQDLEYIDWRIYDGDGLVKEKYEALEEKLADAVYDLKSAAEALRKKMEEDNEPRSE